MRIVGFLLLAAVVVVGLFLFLKKKKDKSACGKVLDLGEKGVDAYYHTKTSSIVDDKKDEQLCKLAQVAAAGTAKKAASELGSHTTIKAALLSATGPATAASQLKDGNYNGAATSIVNTLTGANVLNSLSADIANWPCDRLRTECAAEKKRGSGIQRVLNAAGSGPTCTTLRAKKACA